MITHAVVNSASTNQKDVKTASGGLRSSLMWEVSFKADTAIVAAFADQFLDKHFAWCQKSDPNVTKTGFLAVHRAVRFYMMQEELQKLMVSWKTHPAFKTFRDVVEDSPETSSDPKIATQQIKSQMATGFLRLALLQCRKHNARCAITRRLLRASFAEAETGQIVARLVLGGICLLPTNGKLNREGFSASFDSKMHNQKIDLLKFADFLEQKTKDCIDEIRQSLKVEKERDLLTKIANGCNIWDRADPEVETARLHVLSSHCIQCATQHNCECNVKIGSSVGKTGKGEIMQSVCALASNNFTSSGNEHGVVVDDDFDDAEGSDIDGDGVNSNRRPTQRRRTNQRGPSRMVQGWFNFKSKSTASSAKSLELPWKWVPRHSVTSMPTFAMRSPTSQRV